ncbi:MAG: hypothetical protein WCJ84_05010 [Candidatus Peregrinibacteria bacterium]
MIYIVVFLFLLGDWQASMRGRLSPIISGASILLALILLIVGLIIEKIEMSIVLFFIFVWASIFILMQIYRFSTYHKYFPKVLPILISYGILNGYLLFAFNFSNYFIWFTILTILLLKMNFDKQKQFEDFLTLAENEEQKKLFDESFKNTLKFHFLSSIVYVVSSIGSFLYFYNA